MRPKHYYAISPRTSTSLGVISKTNAASMGPQSGANGPTKDLSREPNCF
jgi:hypothetical protein